MTQRIFLETIAQLAKDGAIDTELGEKATAELTKLDEQNKRRASQPSPNRKKHPELLDEILALVAESESGLTLADCQTALFENGKELKVPTLNGLFATLKNEGKIKATPVKIKGKGNVNLYTVTEEENEGD